ncbi:MAG: hypothetical protein JNK27_02395 [Chitinophagaceae bacterium]|nr:hypothetical protein [Chitinophagaceae bacterium]
MFLTWQSTKKFTCGLTHRYFIYSRMAEKVIIPPDWWHWLKIISRYPFRILLIKE